MKKILYILVFAAFCTAMPPVLKRNASNVCWNNAALQLLRNIEPLTKALLEDKQKKLGKYYGQGDDFADAYIDFLEATFGNDQKKIDDTQQKLYSLTCLRTGVTPGTTSAPEQTIRAFFKSFEKISEKYTDFSYTWIKKNKLHKPMTKNLGSPLSRINLNDALGSMEKFFKYDLKKLPDYIATSQGVVGFDPKVCNYPAYSHIEKYYEPIVIIDAGKSGGLHFWAYVKDEFDDKHPWYKRDDLHPSDKDPINKLPTLTCPMHVLYKKIPGSVEKHNTFGDPLELLGKAFFDITGGK